MIRNLGILGGSTLNSLLACWGHSPPLWNPPPCASIRVVSSSLSFCLFLQTRKLFFFSIFSIFPHLHCWKTCSTACSWHAEGPRKLVVLLKPFSNIDSTKLGCTVTVHTAQWLCQKIYICKHVEFGWQLGWSMLNVNCRQLIKFLLQWYCMVPWWLLSLELLSDNY